MTAKAWRSKSDSNLALQFHVEITHIGMGTQHLNCAGSSC